MNSEPKEEIKQIKITIPIRKATKKQIEARERNYKLRTLRGMLANSRQYGLTDSESEITERINSMVRIQYPEINYQSQYRLETKAIKLGRLYWYLDRGVLTSSKWDPFQLS